MEAILFDVGGTLLALSPSPYEIYQSIFSELDIGVSDEELASTLDATKRRLERMLREGDPPSSVPLLFNEELMDAFGLSRSEGLARTVTRRFSEKMGFRPYPEVCGVLGSLSRHYRLGAISNWSLSTPLDDVLSEHGMLDYFEYTLASNEIGIEKPDPHIFHHALTRMGVEPAHAYYVGDAYIEDVVGAARAGLRPIHIVRGGGTSDAQVSITDLGELYAVIGAEGRP